MKVMKDNLTVQENKSDLCDRKKKPDIMAMTFAGFGIPDGCPIVSNYTFCRKNENLFTFSPATQKLWTIMAMAAPVSTIKLVVTHDSGMSCFEIKTETSRNN